MWGVGVWEAWPVLSVELRVCFSLGSGFWEISSWGNRRSWSEPQLKQKSCLMGCTRPKLGVLFGEVLLVGIRA